MAQANICWFVFNLRLISEVIGDTTVPEGMKWNSCSSTPLLASPAHQIDKFWTCNYSTYSPGIHSIPLRKVLKSLKKIKIKMGIIWSASLLSYPLVVSCTWMMCNKLMLGSPELTGRQLSAYLQAPSSPFHSPPPCVSQCVNYVFTVGVFRSTAFSFRVWIHLH